MSDQINKITTQMRKGILEYIVLSIISNGETYGAEILKQLKENNLIIVEGTLYPMLSRMKKDGLINYNWVESDSGHPRKYYNLTQDGENLLIIMGKSWDTLNKAVNNITK
ncbi:MAG: PadR family transcriptional regulator [Candidatus Gracilibacteria bacterium]|nr:PadR family transcriptional regulator [Candidatus Gracilibacteria bacterium]